MNNASVKKLKYSTEGVDFSPPDEARLDCEKIWVEYKDKVSVYVFSHVSDRDDAEDLVSSVFAKIVQSASSYRGDPSHVSSFVYKTTKNIVIDYYRTRKIVDQLPPSVKSTESIEEDFFKQSTLKFLADSLSLLPNFERQVILLYYYENFSINGIAMQLQESYGKIRIAHDRALKFLRKQFNEFVA